MIRFQMLFMRPAPGLKEIPADPWSDPTQWFVEDETFERVLLDAETREDAISESDAHWARHQEQPFELQAYGYIVVDFERDMAVATVVNSGRWVDEFNEMSLDRLFSDSPDAMLDDPGDQTRH